MLIYFGPAFKNLNYVSIRGTRVKIKVRMMGKV